MGSMVLLEGDAGIGKTTLMREAITAASSEGASVLTARPAAAEAGLAFAGLGDLLADVLESDRDGATGHRKLQHWRLPSCAEKPEGRPVDLHTVSAGVLSRLRALGERDAVLVAVDDLQWLDRGTLAALAFAFRRLGNERVRLIAALRSDHGRALPALIESLPPERITRSDRIVECWHAAPGDPHPRGPHAAEAGPAAHPRADRRQPLLRPRDRALAAAEHEPPSGFRCRHPSRR